MRRPSTVAGLVRRVLIAGVLVVAAGSGAPPSRAQNSSVDGQDACSLSCRDTYKNCKNACDPGDTSCADGCSQALSQCLSNCN